MLWYKNGPQMLTNPIIRRLKPLIKPQMVTHAQRLNPNQINYCVIKFSVRAPEHQIRTKNRQLMLKPIGCPTVRIVPLARKTDILLLQILSCDMCTGQYAYWNECVQVCTSYNMQQHNLYMTQTCRNPSSTHLHIPCKGYVAAYFRTRGFAHI